MATTCFKCLLISCAFDPLFLEALLFPGTILLAPGRIVDKRLLTVAVACCLDNDSDIKHSVDTYKVSYLLIASHQIFMSTSKEIL